MRQRFDSSLAGTSEQRKSGVKLEFVVLGIARPKGSTRAFMRKG
jgi:hypothetical protein